jgi:hypothetical protein
MKYMPTFPFEYIEAQIILLPDVLIILEHVYNKVFKKHEMDWAFRCNGRMRNESRT